MTYDPNASRKVGARKRLVDEVVKQVEACEKNGGGWYNSLIAIIQAVNKYKKDTGK